LPWVAIVLGYSGAGESNADLAFRAWLASIIGTPPQIAAWSVLAFQGYVFLRTWNRPVQRWIEVGLTAAALLACVTGRETIDWRSLAAANPAGIAIVGAGWLVNAWRLQCSYRALVACALAGSCLAISGASELPDNVASFWRFHLPVMVVLALVVLFRDRLAIWLRRHVVLALPAMAVATALAYPLWFGDVPRIQLAGYLGFLTMISIRLWTIEREVPHLTAAGITSTGNLLVLAWPAGEWLSNSWLAAGLPYLSAGAGVVAGGIAVSLLKMGIVRDVREWLHRLNERLLPMAEETS
jgi:hypothetical protein